MSFLLTLSVC